MHIILFTTSYDRDLRTAEDLLARYASTVRGAEALVRAGAEVTAVFRFTQSAERIVQGVRCVFVRDALPPVLRMWHHAEESARAVAAHAPDAVIVHGHPAVLPQLRKRMPSGGPSLLVWQHHGGPDPQGVRRMLRRRMLGSADAVFVTAHEIADAWRAHRMLPSHVRACEVIENAVAFPPRPDRAAARARSGVDGDPALLWVGRLDANKDPITVLAAFEEVRAALPLARLHIVSQGGPLAEVARATAARLGIADAVHFAGEVPRAALTDWYAAADLFVLGSHREGSGWALMEAVACGAWPVVADIPAFRAITGRGAVGTLWPAGSVRSCAQAVLDAARLPRDRDRVRSHFERLLGAEAVAHATLDALASLAPPVMHEASAARGGMR